MLAYRSEYVIEHDFARLKGKPLSLAPMYLRTDERIKGLIRLLTIGLRVLTLCEFVVRRRLAAEQTTLADCTRTAQNMRPLGRPPNDCWQPSRTLH